MTHLFRWLFSSRYRRLLLAREERIRRNVARTERAFTRIRGKIWAAYLNAPDPETARRLAALIARCRL